MQTVENKLPRSVTDGIVEREEHGITILSPKNQRATRRVLYVNGYGGTATWNKVKRGEMPVHHLWGTVQLVRMGYEVALAEPISDFYFHRKPLPHDLTMLRTIRSWLGRDGIVYCAHNKMYWIPLLKKLGFVHSAIVSLLYSREPLDHSSAHDGIIALTPSALATAQKLAPRAKLIHLGWGVEPQSFPVLNYNPRWLLHCGIAGRDFLTLSQAAHITSQPLRIVTAWQLDNFSWPISVTIIDGGRGENCNEKKVSYRELIHEHYANSSAVLITSLPDPEKKHAFGFTNLLEAMAMGRPIILTRTGALADEIDVEKAGCGLHVPPGNPEALAEAMKTITEDPERAAAMGLAARRLCESHYNIDRYARQLHDFFESL